VEEEEGAFWRVGGLQFADEQAVGGDYVVWQAGSFLGSRRAVVGWP
jgi:hypothetical protein